MTAKNWRVHIPIIVTGCLLIGGTSAYADVPECLNTPAVSIADVGANPNAQVWQGDQLDEGVKRIDCASWDNIDINLVAAAAGTVAGEKTLDDILRRIGAVNSYTEILFWSFDREQWEPMFDEASPLTGPDRDDTGDDFAPSDFIVGDELYMYLDESDRVGGMVQRLTVLANDENGVVFQTENVTAGKIWVVEAIAPGGTGGYVSIRRNDAGDWDYYAVTRVAYTGSSFFDIPQKAFANRATALFRHTAGIPYEKEPPAAP